MFQPIGFSRPDSWCKGTPFYLPKNVDEAIEYLDFSSHYERKKLWPTSKIRRAVVTYHLDASVQRSIGYISEEGEKLIVPNKLEITRHRNKIIENIIDQKHYRNVGGRENVNELEGYKDIVYGTIVFNITGLPRSRCKSFRSIAIIENGEILQSKLEKFAILKYKKKKMKKLQ